MADTLQVIDRPCPEACSHPECENRRAMSSRRCPFCRAEIGYQRGYVRVASQRLAHAACATAAVQAGAAK